MAPRPVTTTRRIVGPCYVDDIFGFGRLSFGKHLFDLLQLTRMRVSALMPLKAFTSSTTFIPESYFVIFGVEGSPVYLSFYT